MTDALCIDRSKVKSANRQQSDLQLNVPMIIVSEDIQNSKVTMSNSLKETKHVSLGLIISLSAEGFSSNLHYF